MTTEIEPVRLTKREMQLYDLLRAHMPSVVRIEALTALLFGLYSDAHDWHNVRTIMMRLRKKLGPDVIVTVYGVGYRLTRDVPVETGQEW